MTADGTAQRDVGEVVEPTPYLDLTEWPLGSRLLVRHGIPHPGDQLTLTDAHGYRCQLTLTHLPDPDIAFLEAISRGRGRCEQVTGTSETPA